MRAYVRACKLLRCVRTCASVAGDSLVLDGHALSVISQTDIAFVQDVRPTCPPHVIYANIRRCRLSGVFEPSLNFGSLFTLPHVPTLAFYTLSLDEHGCNLRKSPKKVSEKNLENA
jgi:hypothetical protein